MAIVQSYLEFREGYLMVTIPASAKLNFPFVFVLWLWIITPMNVIMFIALMKTNRKEGVQFQDGTRQWIYLQIHFDKIHSKP